MREAERIAEHLERAFEGNAWHGPALAELMVGVSAEQAAARPIGTAHSIWEIVLHVGAWERLAEARLGGTVMERPPEGDWPPFTDTSPAAWESALTGLRDGNRRLRDRIRELSDADLDRNAPGCDYSRYVLAHGVVQHDLYHAGQIALLRKALPAP